MPKREATGHDPEGKSVIVSEGAVAPITPELTSGYGFVTLLGVPYRGRG